MSADRDTERERCARIADFEAAEYRHQLNESNKLVMYGGGDHIENARLHGRLHAAENIAALIRLTPEAYEAMIARAESASGNK